MQYILKLSIAFTVVYLFYWLLLRRLTFYNWNRWYLLVYSLLCFFIPLVNVFDLLQQHGMQDVAVISYIPAIAVAGAAVSQPGVNWWTIVIAVIAAGSVVMLGRLLIQFLSLKRLQSSAVLLSDDDVKLYHVDQKIIPFSTHSAIYINRHLHDEAELKEIIHHEFIHVKQRHSFDLWCSEILCILNWYNPFAWLIRKAIRHNLEFIADHQVLQSGLDRKQYQYLLLKVTGIAPFSIAPKFNFSSLKKRIVMMNKSKSANINLMRFLFILPLLVVVLLAFRSVATVNNNSEKKITDTIPAKAKPVDVDDLFEKKGVKEITIKAIDKNNKKARVTLKNGTVKTFDLINPEEKEAFEREYGDITPPPPPPPAAPKRVRVAAIPSSPAPVAEPDEAPAVAPVVPAAPETPKAAPAPPKKVHVKVRGTATVSYELPATVTANVKTGKGDVAMVITEAPIVVQSKNVDILTEASATVQPAEVVEVRNVSPVVVKSQNLTIVPAKPGKPAKAADEVIEVRTVQPIKLKLVEAQPKTSN